MLIWGTFTEAVTVFCASRASDPLEADSGSREEVAAAWQADIKRGMMRCDKGLLYFICVIWFCVARD